MPTFTVSWAMAASAAAERLATAARHLEKAIDLHRRFSRLQSLNGQFSVASVASAPVIVKFVFVTGT